MDFFFDIFNDMSPSKLKSYAIIACVIGGIILYLGYQKQQRSKILSVLKASSISSALAGLVKVNGQAIALPDAQNYSPLSKTPAVWYHYTIEENYEIEDEDDPYRVKEEKQSETPFILKDIRGACFIDAKSAEHVKLHQRTWYEKNETPVNIPELGTQQPQSTNYRYRFTETLILPKQTLYVIGEASEIPAYLQDKKNNLDGTSSEPSCLIKQAKDNKAPFYISNENLDSLNIHVAKNHKLMMGGGALLLILSALTYLSVLLRGGK